MLELIRLATINNKRVNISRVIEARKIHTPNEEHVA